jgi:hypothetical protein
VPYDVRVRQTEDGGNNEIFAVREARGPISRRAIACWQSKWSTAYSMRVANVADLKPLSGAPSSSGQTMYSQEQYDVVLL